MSELVNARRLEDYQRLISAVNCRWCNGELGPLEHYDHDGGWPVVGFSNPQWLFATCLDCQYQWALWKLLQGGGSWGRHVARRTFGTNPPQPRAGAGFCTPGYEAACQRAKNSTCVCACEGKNHRKFAKAKQAFAKNLGTELQKIVDEAERTDPVPEQLSEEERYPEDGFMDGVNAEVFQDAEVPQVVEPDNDKQE